MRRGGLVLVKIDKAIKCESWGQRDEAAELYESAADVLNTLAETAPRKQRKEIGRGVGLLADRAMALNSHEVDAKDAAYLDGVKDWRRALGSIVAAWDDAPAVHDGPKIDDLDELELHDDDLGLGFDEEELEEDRREYSSGEREPLRAKRSVVSDDAQGSRRGERRSDRRGGGSSSSNSSGSARRREGGGRAERSRRREEREDGVERRAREERRDSGGDGRRREDRARDRERSGGGRSASSRDRDRDRNRGGRRSSPSRDRRRDDGDDRDRDRDREHPGRRTSAASKSPAASRRGGDAMWPRTDRAREHMLRGGTLQPHPTEVLAKRTTLVFRIDKVGLKDAQDLIEPSITIHIVDKMGTSLERPQVTPTPTGELRAIEPLHVHFGCVVFIRTPMEDLKGCSGAIVFEVTHLKQGKTPSDECVETLLVTASNALRAVLRGSGAPPAAVEMALLSNPCCATFSFLHSHPHRLLRSRPCSCSPSLAPQLHIGEVLGVPRGGRHLQRVE
mgnify:CR=1 FL=1